MLYRYTVLVLGIKEQLETRVAVAEQGGQGWAWLSADPDPFHNTSLCSTESENSLKSFGWVGAGMLSTQRN